MAGIQIMGLASGIDVNGAIDKLIALERLPLTKMAERKNTYKMQQDAWRDVNTRLSGLDNALTDLRLSSTFQGRTAVTSDAQLVTAGASTLAIKGTYEVVIKQTALSHRVASTDGVDEGYATGQDSILNITVGSGEDATTEITIAAGSDLKDIVKAINDSKAPVKATIIGGRLVLESNETGTDSALQLDDGESGLLADLKLLTDVGGVPQVNTIQEARNAEFSINGIELTSQSNTVKDAVQGVIFTLMKDDSTAQVTVKADVDSAVTKIRAFVEQYNSVMSFLAEKTKVTMTDAGDIGSVGTLQGDGTANRLRDALRFQTTSPISMDTGLDYNQLAVLGITTNKEGILQVDEAKLREALQEKPEAVTAFFNEKATNVKGFIKGYVQYGSGILAEKQESIGRLMKDVDRQIERLEERVAWKEESLVRQFTALEKVLAGFQAQGDWLTQQMTQLSSWAPQRK